MAPLGNKNALGNHGGRPTDYKPHYPEMAYKFSLMLRSVTNKKLAELFSVSVATINNWKLAHPEFLDAIRRGGKEATSEVAHSLYHRAVGYEHEAVKVFYDPKRGETIEHKYVERYPPDTHAAKLFLLNKEPEEWREKMTFEVEDPRKILAELLGVSEEEIPE